VTHDQEEAMTTCQRIAVMDQGVIQQVGSPLELFDYPVNRFVAQFIGSVNLFPGEVVCEQGQARFRSADLGLVSLPSTLSVPNGKFELAFRPHAVRFDEEPAGREDLVMQGYVEDTEFLGEFMRYEIKVNNALIKADIAHHRGGRPLSPGTAVRMTVSSNELRFVHA
jgi:iron(III) transport system ATP-binding protein